VVNNITYAISKPGGAISGAVNNTATEIERATRVIERSNIF